MGDKQHDEVFDMAKWYREDRRRPRHNLDACEHAKRLVKELYRVTTKFPDDELYGLRSQLRRAGVSIASNIAEGAARRTIRDFLRFLYNARGSLEEIDAQLEIAGELGYLSQPDVDALREPFDRLSRTLGGLIASRERHLAEQEPR